MGVPKAPNTAQISIGEELLECLGNLGKTDMLLTFLVGVAVDIIVVGLEQHDVLRKPGKIFLRNLIGLISDTSQRDGRHIRIQLFVRE